MLVCHIAGCGRVTGSRTGIPTAGEAGCNTRCADLVPRYLDHVHDGVARFGATDTGLPAAPTAPDDRSSGCTPPDPTGRGCLTPATRHALDEILAAFGPPGRAAPLRSAGCWDPHGGTRAATTPRTGLRLLPHHRRHLPQGDDLRAGWRLATWLRAHASTLCVSLPHLAGPNLAPGDRTTAGGAVPTPAAGSTTPATSPAATTTTSTCPSSGSYPQFGQVADPTCHCGRRWRP